MVKPLENPYNLTTAERHFRTHLLDSLVSDVTTLQRHGWLPNQDFDQIIQSLTFEKTNPTAAKNGASPSLSGAGVPISSTNVAEGSYVDVGFMRFKTYNQKYQGQSSRGVDGGYGQTTHGAAAAGASVSGSVVNGGMVGVRNESKRYVVAVNDFDGEEDEDLGFRTGDVIEVIEDVDENWYRGRLSGKEGIFPKTFVESR